MQAVQLKREIGDINSALKICEQALRSEFSTFHKLWLMKAQLLEELCRIEEARSTYEKALQIEAVRKERIVWLESARFEERQEAFTRSRTIL